ncbi:ribosome-associated translation inhibitor RaiA [Ruminococcus sp. AF14-5]|nr:ribosome-associated translation inhibitor RaiA [Ruminococcus sp. AF14-5]
MRLKITGKNITLTEGIKSAVKDKIKKIEKLVGDDAAVDVMLSAKHGKAKGQRAEITIKTKSSVVRAEVTDEDLYRAINSAVDVVTGRLKKIKEKSRKRAGSDSIRAMEREREDDAVIKEEFEVGADEFEVNGGISREKIVSAESMTRDEACVEMEFTDHDFYVFKDSERDDILCVIYRREAGGYGVLAVLETV